MKNKIFKGVVSVLLIGIFFIPMFGNVSHNGGHMVINPMGIEDPEPM